MVCEWVARFNTVSVWVGLWVDRCVRGGGSGGFRGGGFGCCLVGRVGVGLVDFFFFLLLWAVMVVVVVVVLVVVVVVVCMAMMVVCSGCVYWIYYFIVVDILFYCNVCIILLC